MFRIGLGNQHPALPEPGQMSHIGIEFLSQCLTIDGMKRPFAAELYDHPWILEFREELAAYEQEGSEFPPTPSLHGSSVRSDTLRSELSDIPRDGVHNTSSLKDPIKLYDAGMISPPGVFSDNEANHLPVDDHN